MLILSKELKKYHYLRQPRRHSAKSKFNKKYTIIMRRSNPRLSFQILK